jgi:hypothetical protein
LGIVVAALATFAGAIVMAGPPRQGSEPQGSVGAQAGVGTSFTYQGRLESGGEAVSDDCQMAFRLYDAESGGVEVGSAITTTVPISDGLFTVALDFGSGVFTGDARWLGIRVKCTGDVAYADLGRQALTAAPYALYATRAMTATQAGSAAFALDADTLDGLHASVFVTSSHPHPGSDITSPVTEAISATWATTATYALGSGDAETLDGLDGDAFWQVGGNAGTTPGTNYLGTSDAVSLVLVTNGSEALRIDTAGNVGLGTTSPSEKLTLAAGDFLQMPGAPAHAGAISDDGTTELNWAYGIYVAGNYAYVTAFWDDGVEILDISDPANPTHVGAISDNATTELAGARGIYVAGDYAYVASSDDSGVEVLDISDPANPTHVGAITDNATTELDGAYGIYVAGSYAYVAALIDDGVEILDISDPANPTHVGAITDTATTALDGAHGIYVAGNYAYVASSVDDGVEILDISDPANPTHVGAISDDATTELAGAFGIYVAGNYAYVAAFGDDGVEILDISDPANPTHVGAITDDATTELDGAFGIYVAGNYAYVASYYDDGVEILDISDPANPTHVGAISDNATTELAGAIGIYVAGNYAYVASFGDNGVEVLDITGLDAPAASIGAVEAGTLDVTGNAQVGHNLNVHGGLNVGSGGALVGGDLAVSGDFVVVGTKSAVVATEDYGRRTLYAVESPGNWFEDFGSAQLVDGQAVVDIEPVYAQTVNLDEAYHVYLTPLCDQPVLLFVSLKDATSFTVQGVTLDGQPAQCGFDYRIVARRRGYEDIRLPPVGGGAP